MRDFSQHEVPEQHLGKRLADRDTCTRTKHVHENQLKCRHVQYSYAMDSAAFTRQCIHNQMPQFCIVNRPVIKGEEMEPCYAVITNVVGKTVFVKFIDYNNQSCDVSDVDFFDVPERIEWFFSEWLDNVYLEGLFDDVRAFWFGFVCTFYHDRDKFVEAYRVGENYPLEVVEYVINHKYLFPFVIFVSAAKILLYTLIKYGSVFAVVTAAYILWFDRK